MLTKKILLVSGMVIAVLSIFIVILFSQHFNATGQRDMSAMSGYTYGVHITGLEDYSGDGSTSIDVPIPVMTDVLMYDYGKFDYTETIWESIPGDLNNGTIVARVMIKVNQGTWDNEVIDNT